MSKFVFNENKNGYECLWPLYFINQNATWLFSVQFTWLIDAKWIILVRGKFRYNSKLISKVLFVANLDEWQEKISRFSIKVSLYCGRVSQSGIKFPQLELRANWWLRHNGQLWWFRSNFVYCRTAHHCVVFNVRRWHWWHVPVTCVHQ